MPNAVRFLFTGPAVQRVISASIQVEDVQPGGPASDPPAGSMRLRFRQTDPSPVQICPLLPGTLQFLVDPTAPGVIPDPATDSFTAGDVAGWKRRGRILVTVADAVATEIKDFAPPLPVKPNRVWYGPVVLEPEFFFETLTQGLLKGTIRAANGGTIRAANPNWFKHAIAQFIAGRYAPLVVAAADATKDDRVRFVMPTVEVASNGDVELAITTALAQKPQDAPDLTFEDPLPPVGREEPAHPRNALIPAREVYRQLRLHMVADPPALPLMNAILAEWPVAPRFFPIRFTRTSEAVPNCSAFFPRQTVIVRTGPTEMMQERLPAHGIVFARQEPPPVLQPPPAAPLVEVLLRGTMKWLLGGGTSWRQPGGTAPVSIDLAAVPSPHISVRLPMSEAMLADGTHPSGCGLCCTYMSLRRTVRALVDNRIAGGRLNFGVATTATVTRGLLQRAWQGTAASAGIVANNAPPVSAAADPNVEAPKLIPVLEAFFPGDAPQFPFAGAPPNPIILSRGRMLHDLWQSRVDEFAAPRHRANFPDALVGRGGPGAAVGMGIAAFHVDPTRQPGENDSDYFVRVTNETLVGLIPGAVLQYWLANDSFEEMKARVNTVGASGHSPVFVEYIGPANAPNGIRIIDQNGGARTRTIDAPPFPPLLGGEQVWISANWTE